MITKSVDIYLSEGCGRCSLGGTPDCKVHKWTAELDYLRSILINSELTEECKWGLPCYTFKSKNIILISAFKDYCTINFLKGAIIKDPNKILVKQGENSQSARCIKFTSIDQIHKVESEIISFIKQTIEIEIKGLKVKIDKNPEPIPEELTDIFKEDPTFKSAFEALTPGRQRGYIIFFSAPKQSATRKSRIEKYTEKILNGEGLNDKYSSKKKSN